MVGVEPSHRLSGVSHNSPSARMTTPVRNDQQKPVAAMRAAVSCRRAPSSREIKLPEPCPKKKPNDWMTNIMLNTMPTAAVDCVLIWPTKKVSAML